MSTQPTTESAIVRFFDNFLQEKNIERILATGMLILIGSSLMMVMPRWDAFNPVWKFLTIVGYTGVIFVGGWYSYHKFALRKTGTALLGLTVLMIPISFMSWQWAWTLSESVPDYLTASLLLGLNLVLAVFMSRTTFHHFLQGHQTTFVVSYLVLSFAGALSSTIRQAGLVWTWIALIALWGVFTVGVVKVNRHVFWLTEEQRQPRIFGFFPILLLGGQFFTIFATNFTWAVSFPWIGFGCVLVSIPVLLTADAVANVFQERTGNVVRPIPWPIMLPLTVGLILCLTGVIIAGTAIVQRTPYALVPTAAIATGLMALTARRTNHRAFVWAMLVGVVLTYNFSPVFFQSIARAVVTQGAVAVKESRLPYAFYGLTYLPLILVTSAFAAFTTRRRQWLFAIPLRQFSVAISFFLLLGSLGHVKALFPVATVMLGVFAAQAKLFQDRRLAWLAFAAYFTAAAGAAPFLVQVLSVALSPTWYYLFPIAATVALLVVTPFLDPKIDRIPLGLSDAVPALAASWTAICQRASLAATVIITAASIMRIAPGDFRSTTSISLLLVTLLFVQSLVWLRPALSWFTYIFAVTELLRTGIACHVPPNHLATIASYILLAQWLLVPLFHRYPNHRVSRGWSAVNEQTAWIGLLLSTLLVAVPSMVLSTIGNAGPLSSLISNSLLTLWLFDAARRLRDWPTAIAERVDTSDTNALRSIIQASMSLIGCLCVLGMTSSVLVHNFGTESRRWFPVAWSILAVASIPAVVAARRRIQSHTNPTPERGISLPDSAPLASRVTDLNDSYRSLRAIVMPIEAVTYVLLVSFAAIHLIEYSGPASIAGVFAVGGLLALAFLNHRPLQRQATIALANWTLILASARLVMLGASTILDLLQTDLSVAPWCLGTLAAGSLLVWRKSTSDIGAFQRSALRVVSLVTLFVTLGAAPLLPLMTVLSAATFLALIAGEIWAACQRHDPNRAWLAELLGLVAVGYFVWMGVITFGHGWSMFATLGVGIALYVAGVLTARHDSTSVLAKPFLTTGLWMPLAAVFIGVIRHVSHDGQTVWHGTNSLAILLAGGFYFWRAIEERSKQFAVLSAVIVNVALALLWRELNLYDPQFFMIPIGISILALVRILKREIPSGWHDPLRYAGALTILVSPIFHIVDGSWLHLVTLMIASTSVLLVSIGLRVRALMYTSTAFLIADLVGMVVCGGIDHPNFLWICGIGFGAAVVTLGAFCEHNREKLLQRMRLLSVELKSWE